MRVIWLLALIYVVLPACSVAGDNPRVDPTKINSFDECVRAGYPVMRSLPARCAVPGGGVFTDTKQALPQISAGKLCRDLCGDGTCQEIVCMGEGCPCSESKSSCPSDCK